MFTLLESKEEISKAQQKLECTLQREFKTKIVRDIGFPGGTIFNATAYTDGKYWFLADDHKGKDVKSPRRLNSFGVLGDTAWLEISVEVNTPYEGRNDRVAGFFARDNKTGAIYLLHSGRIGGGKKGVGKTAFLAWSNQSQINVVDSSGKFRDGVMVMPIEGIGAARSAIRYIEAIARFKDAVRAGELDTPDFQRKQKEIGNFYAESRGRRIGTRSAEIDYLSRHGDVVDALHAWRSKNDLPKGGRLVKDVFIDLGVSTKHKLVEIYEVKTSAMRSDVYTALGQLMVHGTAENCKRVLVLPHKENIPIDLRNAMQRLGIELIRFKLDKKQAIILGRD